MLRVTVTGDSAKQAYVGAVLFKLGALTLVLASGAYNWLRLKPKLDGDQIGLSEAAWSALGAVETAPFPWQNRGTYHQVVELTGHR